LNFKSRWPTIDIDGIIWLILCNTSGFCFDLPIFWKQEILRWWFLGPVHVLGPTLGGNVIVKISWKLMRKYVLMIYRSYSNMGHLGLKNVTKPKYRKILLTLEAIIFIQISLKLVKKVVLLISMSQSKLGLLWSKTRSHSPNKMGLNLHNQVSYISTINTLLFNLFHYDKLC
jgi:hypothetical protein